MKMPVIVNKYVLYRITCNCCRLAWGEQDRPGSKVLYWPEDLRLHTLI